MKKMQKSYRIVWVRQFTGLIFLPVILPESFCGRLTGFQLQNYKQSEIQNTKENKESCLKAIWKK